MSEPEDLRRESMAVIMEEATEAALEVLIMEWVSERYPLRADQEEVDRDLSQIVRATLSSETLSILDQIPLQNLRSVVKSLLMYALRDKIWHDLDEANKDGQ